VLLHRVALVAAAAALASGCFSPDYPENLPCDVNGWCPPGQSCNGDSVCVGGSSDGGTAGDAAGHADAQVFDANGLGELLSISIGDDVTLAVEETHQFVVTATYELGSIVVTGWSVWRSSNTAIVWVDFNGLATAAAVGQATITATYEGRVDDAVVTVE